jgi:hypothetical protein
MTDEPGTPGDHLDDELLVALIDGEATDEERSAAEEHLHGCSSCRERRDLLAGTVAVVAVPVVPLPEEVVSEQVRQAIAGAAAAEVATSETTEVLEQPHFAGQPTVTPISAARESRGRQRRRLRAQANVAAAVAVVAVIGLGAFVGELVIHAGGSGSPSAAGTTNTTVNPGTAPTSLVLQLREVVAPAAASCGTTSDPDPSAGVSIADAVDLKPHGNCVLLGPALAVVRGPVRAVESGPGGLSGPDTVTLYLPAASLGALRKLDLASGEELLAVFDGAAVGRVTSARVPAGSATITVVVADLDPAVADYMESTLSPP